MSEKKDMKIENIDFGDDLYPRFEPDQEYTEVTYGEICPNQSPDNLKNMKMGYISEGILYCYGSVPKHFFELEREHNKKQKKKKANMIKIYFMQAEKGGPVKIGSSKNVKSRLSEHQISCPFKLEIIEVYKNKEKDFEYKLHRKYDDYRLHGEWFKSKILELEGIKNDN